MQDEHPATYLSPSIADLRYRATLTLFAFGSVLLARIWAIAARQWSIMELDTFSSAIQEGAGPEVIARLEFADTLVTSSNLAVGVTFVGTAMTFLMWLHRLVALTRVISSGIEWTPSQAVWSFFIPIVSLVRPYRVIAAVLAALAPEKLEAPPPRVDPSAQRDYRGVTFMESTPVALPGAFVTPWWAAFLAMSIIGRLSRLFEGTDPGLPEVVATYRADMFLGVLAIVAAGFGITVVRGLTARAEERFRRIRESPPEALEAEGIPLR